jgi:CysZ protein
MLEGFVRGASAPLRALGLIGRRPQLWRYVLIPILVNVVIFALLTAALLIPGLRLIDAWVVGLPEWAAFLEWVLRLLLIVLLLALNGFLMAQIGVAFGAPWYSSLSAELERILTGKAPPEARLSPATALRDILRALLFQLGRLGLWLLAFLLLLPLNLVPVVGSAAAATGNTIVAALLVSLDMLDPPLDRRLLPFRAKLAVVRRYLGPSLGLGLVSLFLVSVPLLNLLTLPLCIVAGTLLFCEQIVPREQAAFAQGS